MKCFPTVFDFALNQLSLPDRARDARRRLAH